MLYIIGLGLDIEGISKSGLEAVGKCDKAYLESYTVEFPYSKEELGTMIGKEIADADRNIVESPELVEEAKESDIALLVYGSPLAATTHISLIEECKKKGVETGVIHNASVFDAVAETGLQIYKFGKTTSMPNFEANSYVDIIKENQKIGAHTLILVDIGMGFSEALKRLEEDSESKSVKIERVIVCSRLGNEDSKIYYGMIDDLKKKEVKAPFCIVIPGELHFAEKEFLDRC